jgi:uncharacterized protein YciI
MNWNLKRPVMPLNRQAFGAATHTLIRGQSTVKRHIPVAFGALIADHRPDGISPVRDEDPRAGAAVGGGQYAPAMANFAVRLVHGPGWDPSRQIRDQDGWDEHAAFMDGLVEDGFVILGGPVGDGEQTLHVIEAADENDITTRLAGDPWASAGLLEVGTIEPWALWLDSRPRNPAR